MVVEGVGGGGGAPLLGCVTLGGAVVADETLENLEKSGLVSPITDGEDCT
jgi:hypothetical protein